MVDDVIQSAVPIVLESLGKVRDATAADGVWDADKPFVCADYGTADGGTSMPLFYESCAWLWQNIGAAPIQIFYEDQPLNMWHDLFMRLEGIIPGDDRCPNYMQSFDNVFVSAIGRSFYQQVLPASSVHLGFSATAMHWLTNRPGKYSRAIHHTQCNKAEEIAPFAAQAAQDWELNLLQRAKELVPGGRLVMLNFCVDPDGQFLGTTDRCVAFARWRWRP